jgi:NADH:ubiquinone oxidoreductase subunit F (NADH-binding)
MRLADALERAGIDGLGGAGFPAATKLRAVAAQRGKPIVVVNAAEGEPLSDKNRYLLVGRTETVLDGAVAVAAALGADEILIAVDEGLEAESDTIARAARQRLDLRRGGMRASVRAVPSGYVTGQETALISALSGREARPTLTPPYPSERGLRGRPTLVSNIETYSHIGRVARGTYDGTRLLTVSGAVAQPGLVEITPDTTLEGVLQTVGGITEPAQGVLLGGYAGTWTTITKAMSMPLNEHELREQHLTLGPGIAFVLGEYSCPVAEVARVTRWMARESAGQCGPCVHGLSAIAAALEALTSESESDSFRSLTQIRSWSEMVRQRGACAHPDGVSRFVTSALAVFGAEFDDHARYGGCDDCRREAVLPTPVRGASLAAQISDLRTPDPARASPRP